MPIIRPQMLECTLEESRRWCHALMKAAARNFYYGMSLLPKEKRCAMFALYTYMRHIDDIADDAVDAGVDPAIAGQMLEQFRAATRLALAGETSAHPMFPALAHAVHQFCIPADLLDSAIDGQVQDLAKTRYASFDELKRYCYCVASTVGIAAVYIWGFRDSAAIVLADDRGVAFQLTNIIRDIREDYSRGRVYLPQEDLDRFGVDLSLALGGGQQEQLRELILFQGRRAQDYYESSAALESLVQPDARPTLRIMTTIYHGILKQVMADPLAVLSRRVGLSSFAKMREVARELWRTQTSGAV